MTKGLGQNPLVSLLKLIDQQIVKFAGESCLLPILELMQDLYTSPDVLLDQLKPYIKQSEFPKELKSTLYQFVAIRGELLKTQQAQVLLAQAFEEHITKRREDLKNLAGEKEVEVVAPEVSSPLQKQHDRLMDEIKESRRSKKEEQLSHSERMNALREQQLEEWKKFKEFKDSMEAQERERNTQHHREVMERNRLLREQKKREHEKMHEKLQDRHEEFVDESRRRRDHRRQKEEDLREKMLLRHEQQTEERKTRRRNKELHNMRLSQEYIERQERMFLERKAAVLKKKGQYKLYELDEETKETLEDYLESIDNLLSSELSITGLIGILLSIKNFTSKHQDFAKDMEDIINILEKAEHHNLVDPLSEQLSDMREWFSSRSLKELRLLERGVFTYFARRLNQLFAIIRESEDYDHEFMEVLRKHHLKGRLNAEERSFVLQQTHDTLMQEMKHKRFVYEHEIRRKREQRQIEFENMMLNRKINHLTQSQSQNLDMMQQTARQEYQAEMHKLARQEMSLTDEDSDHVTLHEKRNPWDTGYKTSVYQAKSRLEDNVQTGLQQYIDKINDALEPHFRPEMIVELFFIAKDFGQPNEKYHARLDEWLVTLTTDEVGEFMKVEPDITSLHEELKADMQMAVEMQRVVCLYVNQLIDMIIQTMSQPEMADNYNTRHQAQLMDEQERFIKLGRRFKEEEELRRVRLHRDQMEKELKAMHEGILSDILTPEERMKKLKVHQEMIDEAEKAIREQMERLKKMRLGLPDKPEN